MCKQYINSNSIKFSILQVTTAWGPENEAMSLQGVVCVWESGHTAGKDGAT